MKCTPGPRAGAAAMLWASAGLLAAGAVRAQTPAAATFNQVCAHCHGGNGQGGQLGPSILGRVTASSDADLAQFLREGNPLRGMPPVTAADAELGDLIGYLRDLAATAPDAGAGSGEIGNRYASIPAIENYEPVTDEMLLNPSPDDWLWFSRTPDAQRFSPLDQINLDNVDRLTLAWSRNLPDGITETIPTVHDGIMYLTLPGSDVAAYDATTGDQIWRYSRDYEDPAAGGSGRSKTLSIYADMVYFTAPDSTVVALDAKTGAVRWEARADTRGHTAGSIVVDGKVISGGACGSGPRGNCYIAAHDALTGELAWKFYTAQGPDEPPGFDTWAGAPLDGRLVSTWGLPGSFDPETGLVYWGVSNPMPNRRADRHGGHADAIPYGAPADLFSNSTVALDPETGELAWYYQHLPGDDWDEDMNQERTLLTTPVSPDPKFVRWINPAIRPGERRDVSVNVGEGGGIWVLDRHNGEFLWATPFPFDTENFLISDINIETGRTVINEDLITAEPGEHHIICYFNTRSYWPTAYYPARNALYVPYIRNCLNMTAPAPAKDGMPATRESRIGIPEPGVALDELNGLARVDMETGEITHWPTGPIPTNSAILATAGGLIFWGDINRRYRALDADTGEVVWETILGAPISTSNITYAVDGRQYIAVVTGQNLSHPGLNTGTMGPVKLNLSSADGSNAIYVFALPERAAR